MRARIKQVWFNSAVVYALAAAAAAVAFSSVRAADERPYLGEWSNGRGETLKVTASTIQFGTDKAVAYRDVTRATDGSDFELQITAAGKVNAFPGKTLGVHCEGDTMKMTGYASHAAYMQGGDVQMEVTWDRDSDEDDHSD